MTDRSTPQQPLAEELRRTQRKCFQLRDQLRTMHAAFDASETAALRAEAAAYKKALSNIRYRLERGEEIDPKTLRQIVLGGLELRTVKPARRRFIERASREPPSPAMQQLVSEIERQRNWSKENAP